MDEPASTVVVVGASAGGVEALTTLAGGLPEDLHAEVCVVRHLPRCAESRLASISSRATPRHALVVRGPHENDLRPSIDVLFLSPALAFGRRAAAVVLSGARDNGVVGASVVS